MAQFRPFGVFILLYLLLFFIKLLNFDYAFSWSRSFGGWNGDAFFWSFAGQVLALEGWTYLKELVSTFPKPFMQMPFQGLLSPIYTLLVFIFYKLGLSLKFLWYTAIVIYGLSFYFMDRILKELGFSITGRFITLLAVFLSPYTLQLSFKLRPDNFAFVFALLGLFFILKNRHLIAGILFSISVFGFKIQLAGWIPIAVYFLFIADKRDLKKKLVSLAMFVMPIVLAAISYLAWYTYLSDLLPLLIEKLKEANTIHTRYMFNTYHKLNLLQLIGLIGLGLLGIIYLYSWLPVMKILTGKSLVPSPFPHRSLYSTFILEMGLGFMYEISKRFKKRISRIVMLSFLFGSIAVFSAWSIKSFITDWKYAKIEDNFYRKIVQLSNEGKVCSYEYYYVPAQYLRLFVETPNLPYLPYPISENCDYYAIFVSHLSNKSTIKVFDKELHIGDYAIFDSKGNLIFFEQTAYSSVNPKYYLKFSRTAYLIALTLWIIILLETIGFPAIIKLPKS